ncbi:MAG: regulator [gamma proteobacterium symbiont of Ctena orbiculata]|uniref:zinc ribbon domain-containing protein n=1 Tax=Candidatus Thiodiazotropha sp. CDECU1 TaxID=3065865 RepID=UPI000D56C1EC|nr:zinc ribbon domain-containing protein [Candidatus Thiodiazotropha sp. CDECU1]PVV18182.1 MAG: regulator [gamma proteobacterium symbiont of Ctena orbiculata]PVV23235.1 MAG: regulator [gamma proteobacterium symbiont of Ctena orbiculata]
MPTYDYYCDANGEKVEVFHPMNETISNWGALCKKVDRPLGDTAESEPVRKLIGGAAVISSASRADPEPACPAGGCCPSGGCGFNE